MGTHEQFTLDDGKDIAFPTRALITAADVPMWMARDDKRGRVVELRLLVKNWASFPDRRFSMIQEAPRRHRWFHRFTSRRRDLPRVAAVVHALCERDGMDPPAWVWEHRSPKHIAVTDDVSLGTAYGKLLRADAPDVCSYHRVWFSQAMLESIGVTDSLEHDS